MNPLSAINAYVAPNGLIQMLPKTGAAQPVADAEFQKLSTAAPASFENMLTNMVHDVTAKQQAANTAVNGLLSGQNVSLHQAMISAEEANVSFQLMVEVRNRLLESYQELMRMQI